MLYFNQRMVPAARVAKVRLPPRPIYRDIVLRTVSPLPAASRATTKWKIYIQNNWFLNVSHQTFLLGGRISCDSELDAGLASGAHQTPTFESYASGKSSFCAYSFSYASGKSCCVNSGYLHIFLNFEIQQNTYLDFNLSGREPSDTHPQTFATFTHQSLDNRKHPYWEVTRNITKTNKHSKKWQT